MDDKQLQAGDGEYGGRRAGDQKQDTALCPVCRVAILVSEHGGASWTAALRQHLESAGDSCLLNVHAALATSEERKTPRSSDMASLDKRKSTFNSPDVLEWLERADLQASVLAEAGYVVVLEEEGRWDGKLRCFHCHLELRVTELRHHAGVHAPTLDDLLAVHVQKAPRCCLFAVETLIQNKLQQQQHADSTSFRGVTAADMKVPDADVILNLPAVQSIKYVFPFIQDAVIIQGVAEYHRRPDNKGSWPTARQLYAILEETFPSVSLGAVCFWDSRTAGSAPETCLPASNVYPVSESPATTDILAFAAAHAATSSTPAQAVTSAPRPDCTESAGRDAHQQAGSSTDLSTADGCSYSHLLRKNRTLKMSRLCYRCKTNPRSTTLLPCGHFLFCENCSQDMTHCDACDVRVLGDIRTYLS